MAPGEPEAYLQVGQMQIPDTWASLLVTALRDAMRFNERLLESEALREHADHEEHLVQLSLMFEHVKEEYRRLDPKGRVPIERLL